MRISAKGRYALASMIDIARHSGNGEYITVISISERLGISRIYLEQVFSLLKRGGLVTSVKGAQGGYLLARMPRQISAYDILSAVELSLFEPAEKIGRREGARSRDGDAVICVQRAGRGRADRAWRRYALRSRKRG